MCPAPPQDSRVTSSTTFSTLNRRPDAIWSCTKSRLQRWFGRTSTGAGARVPNSTFAAPASPDRQSLLTVKALGLLAVDHHALPAQQDMQATIAEPASLVRQLAQLLAKLGIASPLGAISHALTVGSDHMARPPLAHPVTILEMINSFPLRGGRQN
jgi:hypothetical protein